MTTKKQTVRGVALISVMVVVAVVAASAAQLLYRQNIDIERSTRIMSREQAFLFAFGLETYARELLARDSPDSDYHFNFSGYEEGDPKVERWSWPIPNWDMPDEWLDTFRRIGAVHLEARVHDLSGLFNLNGVHRAVLSRKPDNKPDDWEILYEQMFKDMVAASFGEDEVNAPDADALWNALLDWFDPNSEALDGGAEDDDYLNYDPPYLTGQRRMAWPEEIRLVEGFDGRVAERLLPLMSALPHTAQVRMNINTMEDRLLRHIPGFAESGLVGEIVSRRSDHIWFKKTGDIKTIIREFRGPPPDSIIPAYITEKNFDSKSEFFLFSACVRFGRDRPIEIQSMLRRKYIPQADRDKADRDKVVVLQRRMGSGYYKGGDCKERAALVKPGSESDDAP